MTNTNCLEGIRCPNCGQEDRFFIMGCAQFEVTDDGSEAVGDHEWDEGSSTRCPECNHSAPLKDFRKKPDLPHTSASGAHPIRKQLTSTAMFHTPGLFRALQNDYRIKGRIRQQAVKILSDGYGLSPDEAQGLLSGSIPVEINEGAGTITYEAEFRREPELPPDPDDKNGDRAAWAGAALAKFVGVTGTDEEDALGDLLTDLMHWSDRHNYDFDAALDRARFHYEAETTPASSP